MKKKIYLTFIFICIILINFKNVSAENNEITMNFFYTEDCNDCHSVEPIIDNIETDYPNVTINRYLVLVDEKLDNYSLFSNFYRFEHVPAVTISNNSYNYVSFKSHEINYLKLSLAIEKFLSNNNPNLKKVNDSGVYVDYYYTPICGHCMELKEKIIDEFKDYFKENSSLFFRNKKISEYNWDYQKYVNKYQTAYPFLILKDFINETILYEKNLTEDKILSTLNNTFGVTLNYQNQSINETKDDNGFFLPGFEIIQLLLVLTIFFIINKKKKNF